ncbi:hypothetical protein GCM10010435_67390 [Winogradskya consettensis]|uniref:N-acetyltransferase domain-containing protein n=1 Tax=Winogradskya consettensis TaxID=113560 RepID=A0A919SMV3_9ACTN|nr:GNAT family N-acetyltransferase [Actinoplanes consettensis]GIM73838.1 hypothetical protein Aco04nite_37380 [Actinoplanes consettensis]
MRDLITSWQRGWGAARGLPPATDVGGGLRVHSRQTSREVDYYALDADSLRGLAELVSEEEATTWLHIPTTDPEAALATLESAGQVLLNRREWLMTTDLRDHPRGTVTAPYQLNEVPDGDTVVRVEVWHDSGEQAARGTLGLSGRDAVPDKVLTWPSHRRRGLGRAVMGTLAQTAISRGAERGLLIASDEGRHLYGSLGWKTVAEVLITAVPGTVYPT